MDEHEATSKTPQRPQHFWGPLAVISTTIILYFVAQFVASFALLGVHYLLGGTGGASFETWVESGPFPQFIYVLFTDGIIMGVIYGMLRYKKASFKTIGLKKPRLSDFGWAFATFLVYLVTLVTITALAKLLVPSLNVDQEQQLGFESTKNAIDLIMIGISLVILPPLVEEILMRGFLYTGLKTKLPIWPSAIITSIIFAAAHLQLGSGAPPLWVGAIDTFILSLYLIYLREKTGGLASPIFLHMLKNGLAFSILFIFSVK